MCLLPSHLETFFLDLLKKCTDPTLKLIYQRSVENMVQELSKGNITLYLECILKYMKTFHSSKRGRRGGVVAKTLKTLKLHFAKKGKERERERNIATAGKYCRIAFI